MEKYVIPNLRNACLVLKALAKEPGGLKVSDLARQLDLPSTSTLRIVHTLALEGLVRKEDARVLLGPALIHLGAAAIQTTSLREAAQPVLEALALRTDETAHVAVPLDRRSLILAVQDSPHPLRAASRPGFLADLHCSSTGKVFLAFVHHETLAETLPKPPFLRRTPHTHIGLDSLTRNLEAIQAQGYSVDDEEWALGVRCLAAPVRDAHGKVVAAIGITAATLRFGRERIPEMAAHVMAAARDLSSRIGAAG
jgi:DNA-binding IclR family transcriptional regulator